MKKLWLTSLLSLFILLQVQAQEKYSFRQTYQISSPAGLNLETEDGYIKVEGSETEIITIDFLVYKGDRLLDISLAELEEHVELTITKNSNELSIKVEQPHARGWVQWDNRYRVSFRVNVPEATSCRLASSDGDISVRNLTGFQKCATSDGDVMAMNIHGDLTVATSDGDIVAEGIDGISDMVTSDGDIYVNDLHNRTRMVTSDGDIKAVAVEGDATLVTSDGSIQLERVTGVSTATTSDGSVFFTDLAGSLMARTSDGDIEGSFMKLTAKTILETSDGDIRLAIPMGTGLNLRAEGEDVYIPMQDFSGTAEEDYAKGTYHNGGVEVKISSSDGDVRLEFR
ncbi:MAG: DUF4097 domain-containing protein [Bacteroidetes bacterium]|nr:DUF4097 domain-containing protein [Bacteroidota bacterium]